MIDEELQQPPEPALINHLWYLCIRGCCEKSEQE